MLKTKEKRTQVLLIDDEENSVNMMALALRQAGIVEIAILTDSRLVAGFLSENQVALVLLDLHMPNISGQDLLMSIRLDHPNLPVVIVTGSKDIDTAIQCMKLGAIDYLVKPLEINRLLACVRNGLNTVDLQGQLAALKRRLLDDALESPAAFSGIVTCSKKMRGIFQYVEAIAPSPQPILITGETGVGKELIARAVHRASGVTGPFTTVNVAGLDDAVFSDTLFGHKKGAFTGAESARDGLIARAAEGTLFLDEIGDLGEPSQIKLLRLLQQNEYYPVGSDILKKSTARIIVATNVDLDERIADGRFRRDLYYRLCTHHVYVPPLRQRPEDIPLLAFHFLEEAARLYGKPVIPLSPEAIGFLKRCHFQGNVRQLQAVINDAVARHVSGPLLPAHLMIPTESKRCVERAPASNDRTRTAALAELFGHFPTSREVEERHLDEALELAHGDQRLAAAYMGVTRKTVYNRLSARKPK